MSDDPTDAILGGLTAGSLVLCAICVGVNAWRSARWPSRGGMKVSRSNDDLTNILEQAIPVGPAARRDPMPEPSEA